MKKLIIAAAIMAALQGCASIVGDTQYPVAIASEPAGASFELRDSTGRMIDSGVTPHTVTLKSSTGYFQRAEYSVLVKKTGYADQTVPLHASISGWYWGNIVFGGLIGMLAVDPATGAMYKLPEGTNATLTPLAPVASK
jgi:hypothetical protein